MTKSVRKRNVHFMCVMLVQYDRDAAKIIFFFKGYKIVKATREIGNRMASITEESIGLCTYRGLTFVFGFLQAGLRT
jgi:hypothetical protein